MVALIVALSAPSVLGDREVLRQRLDSLNVEMQLRKRGGKPIDDLEAESAVLRDSIVGLRASPAGGGLPAESPPGGSVWDRGVAAIASFLDSALSFKPSGLFDWVIVGTGVVALLSGLLLFIGLVAGRRKGAAAKNKAMPPEARKVNLAPQTSRQPAVPAALPDAFPGARGAAYRYNGLPAAAAPGPMLPSQIPPEFETLMQNLRDAASAPQPAPAMEDALPPPPPPPKTPPPSQLIVEGTGASASARRGANIPKAGSPGFGELVAADSKSGLSDVEISRKYQISVDQVRLMLRMKQE